MDWLLDTRLDQARALAASALEDHLRRHASEDALVGDAVAEAREVISDGGLLWLHLDWTKVLPTLHVRPVDTAEAPSPGFGRVSALEREKLAASVTGEPRSVELVVPRDMVLDFDPDVARLVALDPLNDGPACAAVAMAAAAESHPVATPDQVAAAAGAMLADAAVSDESALDSPEAVLASFGRLYEAIGGSWEAVHHDQDRIELLVDGSPFGTAIAQIPSLARVTEAMAGRLAARVTGRATVVHDESLGLGDPADRLQVFLGDHDEDVCGSIYRWPPAGTREESDASPRLEMTVALPRQSHSVPVIRRLAAQILRAFGVAADSIHDVELAISEACANVIQHAIDSDGYEVSIELASDRCAISVIDRGEGFDAAGIAEPADTDAESGRGLSLMRALVDNLNFVNEPKVGAVVHMVKQLDYDNEHPFRRSGVA